MSRKSEMPDFSIYEFTTVFIKIDFPMQLLSPARKKGYKSDKQSIPTLAELGAAMGLNTENKTIKETLKCHQDRFRSYQFLHQLLSFVVYLLIGSLIFLLVVLLAYVIIGDANTNFTILFLLPLLILFYIAIRISQRIVSAILDPRYADTLSFVSCLYLLANLAKNNPLVNFRDRKQLLSRIRALKKYILLIPNQYSVDEIPTDGWARKQFKRLAQFTEEKENQIIAPLANSQRDLFEEITQLLNILLSGNYGEFKYEAKASSEAAIPKNIFSVVTGGILKFLGTVIPIVLLVVMYFFPEQFKFLGIDNKIVSLVSLAWLLLAIDANLKLGIVDRIIGLAKAMKELG